MWSGAAAPLQHLWSNDAVSPRHTRPRQQLEPCASMERFTTNRPNVIREGYGVFDRSGPATPRKGRRPGSVLSRLLAGPVVSGAASAAPSFMGFAHVQDDLPGLWQMPYCSRWRDRSLGPLSQLLSPVLASLGTRPGGITGFSRRANVGASASDGSTFFDPRAIDYGNRGGGRWIRDRFFLRLSRLQIIDRRG